MMKLIYKNFREKTIEILYQIDELKQKKKEKKKRKKKDRRNGCRRSGTTPFDQCTKIILPADK